jgi:hypothetical protein
MLTLMNNIKQNTTCANQLKTSGFDVDDCVLKGTCKSTTQITDCTAPENKDAPYCRPNNFTSTDINPKAMDPTSMVAPNFDKSQLGKLGLNNLGGAGDEGLDSNPLAGSGTGSKTSTGGVPGGNGPNLALSGSGGYNAGRGNGRMPTTTEDSNYGSGYTSGNSGFSPFGSNKNVDGGDKYAQGNGRDPKLDLKITEGITSPQGLTLFEKVSNSYKNNRALLMPE